MIPSPLHEWQRVHLWRAAQLREARRPLTGFLTRPRLMPPYRREPRQPLLAETQTPPCNGTSLRLKPCPDVTVCHIVAVKSMVERSRASRKES